MALISIDWHTVSQKAHTAHYEVVNTTGICNSCRVELNGFSVELDDRGLKSCTRVQRIIYEVPKGPGLRGQGGYIDIWLIHELRDEDMARY